MKIHLIKTLLISSAGYISFGLFGHNSYLWDQLIIDIPLIAAILFSRMGYIGDVTTAGQRTALFAVLAAAGLSFGVLFMAITMITGMKRRKRGTPSLESENGYALPTYSEMFSQVLWEGM